MMPPCEQVHLQQKIILTLTDQVKCEFSLLGTGHFLVMRERFVFFFIFFQVMKKMSAFFRRLVLNNRPIGLMNLSPFDHFVQSGKGFAGFCENDNPAYRPIDTVNNSQEYIAGLMVTLFDECFEKITEWCIAGFISLDDLGGLLVKDDKMIVFEKNIASDRGPVH